MPLPQAAPEDFRLRPPAEPHSCHATGCKKAVRPALLMCLPHWRMVPKDIQKLVWKNYRPGQEVDKRPTREYLEVMKRAIRAVEEAEGFCALPRRATLGSN